MAARSFGAATTAGALALCGGATLAQGDPEQGEKVFNKCKACHAVDEPQNRLGPHPVGLLSRAAGSVEGFRYSAATKEASITRNADTTAEYVADPRGFIHKDALAANG